MTDRERAEALAAKQELAKVVRSLPLVGEQAREILGDLVQLQLQDDFQLGQGVEPARRAILDAVVREIRSIVDLEEEKK